ncbi:hypothetical protein Q7P37_007999 [Cladosporium fusiforme]
MSSLDEGEGPRNFTITPDDHGGIMIVVGCILMTWTILCFVIRLYNRFMNRSSLGLDDYFCGLATIMGVVQTLVMCIAVSHGFGKSLLLVSASRIHLVEKYMYAVSMLSLCANAMSKASMLFFHLRITPLRSQRTVCYVMVGVCMAWMAIAVTLVGTRCGNIHPWMLHGRKCNDYSNRWVGIAVTDSILEILIFILPVWILYDVHTKRSYKIMILVAFASRLLVPITAGLHASTAHDWATTSPNFAPVAAVLPFIWLNIETNYAIMSATFPTLGTFVKSLNTRWGALDGPEVAQYGLESLSEQSRQSRQSRQCRIDAKTGRGRKHLTAEGGNPALPPESSTYSFKMRNPSPPGKKGITASRTRGSDASDQMIIRKTVSTRVETAYQP